MDLIKQSRTERAIIGNTVGALTGLSNAPTTPGMLGNSSWHAFRGIGATAGYTLKGLGHGMVDATRATSNVVGMAATGPYYMARDYLSWRNNRKSSVRMARGVADFVQDEMEHHARAAGFAGWNPNEMASSVKEARDLHSKYGRQYDSKTGQFGARRFGVRTPLEHMRQGTKNFMKYSVMSPMAWGLHTAFAGIMSDDNLGDPKKGIVPAFASSVLGEAGFFAGSTAGAALATMAMPHVGLLAGAGWLLGGIGGAVAGSMAVEKFHSFAELGMKYGRHSRPMRSSFLDSEMASTMRQRGLKAIYRSQMNSRSALGSEALSYHG